MQISAEQCGCYGAIEPLVVASLLPLFWSNEEVGTQDGRCDCDCFWDDGTTSSRGLRWAIPLPNANYRKVLCFIKAEFAIGRQGIDFKVSLSVVFKQNL